MSDPKEVLSQLLSQAQAETLNDAGIQAWTVVADALRALQGAAPNFTVGEARLVMPNEITVEFGAPHLAVPIELSTNQDQEALAYLVLETSVAASYLGSAADNSETSQ